MAQTQYSKGTVLADKAGKQMTVEDPNQFFSEDYSLKTPDTSGTTPVPTTAPAGVAPTFTPPALTSQSEAAGFVESAAKNAETQKAQVEKFRNEQLKSIDTQKKEAEAKQKEYAAQEKGALDSSKPLTSAFRETTEKSERERLKVEENYFANQKTVGELDTLMNEAVTKVEEMKGVTGLDAIRNPKIQKAVTDYNARIGVLQAVMAARNDQITVAENLIDRTITAVNSDRQDALKYYDAVRSYYSGLKDDQGKKLVTLAGDEEKIIEERVSEIKKEIADSQAVGDTIKKMMFEDPQRVESSGITVNDSMETISNKLSEYDYKKGVMDVRNKMSANDYAPVSNAAEAKKLAAAGRQVVEIEDIKGNKSYYVAPPAKATGGSTKKTTTPEEDFEADLKLMRSKIASQGVTPESAFTYLKTQYDISDEEDAMLRSMLGIEEQDTEEGDKGWLPTEEKNYFGDKPGWG